MPHGRAMLNAIQAIFVNDLKVIFEIKQRCSVFILLSWAQVRTGPPPNKLSH